MYKNGTTFCFKLPDHLWGEGNECSPGDAAESWFFVPLMVAADILQAFYYRENKSTAPTPAEKRSIVLLICQTGT